jgi:hypothetical protein
VSRLAFLLALALCVAQATPVAATAAPGPCEVACADDAPDGKCAPICDDCACCDHAARPLMVDPEAVEARSTVARSAAPVAPARAPTGEPADVFHVPRAPGSA